MSPEIAIEAGWIVLYAMYAVCAPVHRLSCNRRPATPSGVAESCCGGRLAAIAISVVIVSLLRVFDSRSCGVRSNASPGSPGYWTDALTNTGCQPNRVNCCPIRTSSTGVSIFRYEARMRSTGFTYVPCSVVVVGPKKSVSRTPLTRIPCSSGAARRMPSRESRALNTVRPWFPRYVPGRWTWVLPQNSRQVCVESYLKLPSR